MVAQARSADIMLPGCPEDGGHDTFSPPDRHRSAPCTSGRRWPWHVQRPFCAQPAQRLVVQARSAAIMCPARPGDGGSGTFCSGYVPCAPEDGRSWHVLRALCSSPARRMAVLTRSAVVLCPGRQKDGGPGTFCGHSVPCPPGGWRPWHVMRALCSLPARRLVVLTRSTVVLCPGRQKDGGPDTFCGHSEPLAFSATFRWAEERGGRAAASLLQKSGWACCRVISAEKWSGVLPRHSCRKVVGSAAASLLLKLSGVLPHHSFRKLAGVLPCYSCTVSRARCQCVGWVICQFRQKAVYLKTILKR